MSQQSVIPKPLLWNRNTALAQQALLIHKMHQSSLQVLLYQGINIRELVFIHSLTAAKHDFLMMAGASGHKRKVLIRPAENISRTKLNYKLLLQSLNRLVMQYY